MSRVVAIIQARMGSSRLPGKVLIDLAGKPMLEWVVSRTQRARTIDHLVVATSYASADDAVQSFCAAQSISCFRGSEKDVLDRYFQAAQHATAGVIVRITADCPLIDPVVLDHCVSSFLCGGYDYVSNTQPPTYPDGLDTEVFSSTALERAWREAGLPSEREHVTPYLYNHPELFRLGGIANCEDYSHLRWTVDHEEDLAFARLIHGALGDWAFGMHDVLDLLQQHPALDPRAAPAMRNEGYAKSLREDRTL